MFIVVIPQISSEATLEATWFWATHRGSVDYFIPSPRASYLEIPNNVANGGDLRIADVGNVSCKDKGVVLREKNEYEQDGTQTMQTAAVDDRDWDKREGQGDRRSCGLWACGSTTSDWCLRDNGDEI